MHQPQVYSAIPASRPGSLLLLDVATAVSPAAKNLNVDLLTARSDRVLPDVLCNLGVSIGRLRVTDYLM